jgi:hypothetical protein
MDEENKPIFNGDDMLLPLFIDELDPWFAENHPTAYAFLEDGFTVYKDKVIVYNAEQAAIIAANTNVAGSFSKPHTMLPKSSTALTADLKERFKVGHEQLTVLEPYYTQHRKGAPRARRAAERVTDMSKSQCSHLARGDAEPGGRQRETSRERL